jgi:hypothetical protein
MAKTWYQTRYALTSGIQVVTNGTIRGDYVDHSDHGWDKINRDIFDSLEAAQADQRHRARKAIVSAKRTIAKMEKLILKSGGSIDG